MVFSIRGEDCAFSAHIFMRKKLLGNVYFRLFAADCGDIVNKLRATGFAVRDIRIESGKFVTGTVSWFDLDELKAFAEDNKVQFEQLERKGVVFTVQKYRKRFGIAAGFLAAIMLIFYCSNTVLRIEVYGNESISDERVKSILADNGIRIGAFIPSLDLRDSEQRILTALDSFSWIGIRSSGCRILVDISELTEKPEIIPISTPCNVVAACDAQIVDIRNVYLGMLVPMLYDGVRKGDILISGTVDGKLDHDYFVHAMGEVIGRYDREVTFEQPYFDSVINYGSEKTKKSLYLFGLRIPLYLNKEEKFEYEYSEEIKYAQLFGLELPIGTVEAEIKPYTVDEIEYSPEQAKILLESRITLYEKNFLEGKDITVVGKKVDFTEDDGKMTVRVEYCLESDIGITQEILAKK